MLTCPLRCICDSVRCCIQWQSSGGSPGNGSVQTHCIEAAGLQWRRWRGPAPGCRTLIVIECALLAPVQEGKGKEEGMEMVWF